MNIGIDRERNLFYEGTGNWGHAVWPSPMCTVARIVFDREGELEAEDRRALVGDAWVFREDYFDPVARIRRGRFYKAGDMQPVQWKVQVHPAFPSEAREVNRGVLSKSLETFYGNSVWHQILKDRIEQPLVLLGFEERFTVWVIIDVESISTGEDLVTLKACSSLGVLPQIEASKIPEPYREAVLESIDGFLEEVSRAAPVSVIDRARDTITQILLAYFGIQKSEAKELARLAKDLEAKSMVIAACAAKIVARLHARAKPVEKLNRPLREIREQDAELATQCVGVILCDIGWGHWR